MHFDQELIRQKLQAMMDMLEQPVPLKPPRPKKYKIDPQRAIDRELKNKTKEKAASDAQIKREMANRAKDILEAKKLKRLAEQQGAKPKTDYNTKSSASSREKPIPSRPLNLQDKIRLQIDHRTWVYVDPDADFEAIKAKYKTRPLIKDRDDSPPAYQF